METFKLRASAGGKLATNPRLKNETLSQTTKTYVETWVKERIYGTRKDFDSKYTDKGNILEDEAIDTAIEWLDLPFVIKNEEFFEDEYFMGTPDLILEDMVLDVKCSWDCFTFPLFDAELPTKDYFYQLQIYMHLTGKTSGKVVYLLLNTPENVASWEPKHDYSEIDQKYRIKTFDVVYDPAVIEMLQNRVIESRNHIKLLTDGKH